MSADRVELNIVAPGKMSGTEGVTRIAGDQQHRTTPEPSWVAADVQANCGEVLDGRALVYGREQAVATGMFGPDWRDPGWSVHVE